MLPLRIFSNETPKFSNEEYLYKRARNAVKKALKVQPTVKRLLWLENPHVVRRYYLVYQKHEGAREHLVRLVCDRDGEWFGDCNCPAGNPEADPNTGLIKYLPGPCYAMAAALVHYTQHVQKGNSR